MSDCIRLNNVEKSFNGRTILSNTNIKINDTNHVYLVGTSGKGKTTLLNIIARMLDPDVGTITLNDLPMGKDVRPNIISYMPCGDTLIESLTVYENLLLSKRVNLFSYELPELTKRIKRILVELKIDNIAKSYPREISSGEYKRVCFARTIIQDGKYLLFDEPTSNLDEESAGLIINMFKNDAFKDKAVIVATHDSRLIEIGKKKEVISL